jgi:long-chain acyl-CoA synthetase
MLVDLRIADADDNEVPRGTVGEVQLRGPNIMKGFWKQPEATAIALHGGWYHSGDGGYMDADGYLYIVDLYIVDRLKDMIITGGENVYSADVETRPSRASPRSPSLVSPMPNGVRPCTPASSPAPARR